jgi:twinkle protein
MATEFSDDDIDFDAYMKETDCDHKVRPASSYADDVVAYYHTQNPEMLGATLPWPKTQGCVRIRPGEVSVWGGYNGHGKSLVLGQVINHFGNIGQKTCIASLEMKPHLTLARMCRQQSGAIPSPEFIREFHRDTNGKLWLYDQQGVVKGDRMLAVIRYAVDKFGITQFVIDSLMKCGLAEDDYNGQKHFIDNLCAIARDTNAHIHLVHHSRKGKDEFSPPGKHDMKGTGAIIDQVDNLFIVWRNKKKEEAKQAGAMGYSGEADALISVEKQRNGEWEGKFNFWFDPAGRGLVETLIY